jgi:hypothetical protein
VDESESHRQLLRSVSEAVAGSAGSTWSLLMMNVALSCQHQRIVPHPAGWA